MLTSSSNQYLRPEYLTPLPTTLDAKKSPLALLAQTCSQIGADPLPSSSSSGSTISSKSSSLLSSLHDVSGTNNSGSVGSNSTSSSSSSSSTNSNNNSNNSGSGSKKSKSSHHHLNVGMEHYPQQGSHHRKTSNSSPSEIKVSGKSSGRQDKSGDKDVAPRFTPPLTNGGGNNSNSSSSAGSGRGSTTPDEKIRVKTPSSAAVNKTTSGSPSLTTSTSNSSPREPANKSPVTCATAAAATSMSSSTATADALLSKPSHDSPVIPLTSPAFSTSSSTSTPLSASSKLNLNGTLGGLTSSELSLSSLKSHGNSLPFPGLYPGLTSHTSAAVSTATGIPPYLHSYARLKAAANGTDSLVSNGSCRDPFCTGCQLGAPHLPSSLTASKSCPAGCLQCDHHKSPFFSGCGSGGVGQGFPFLPGFPIPPGFYSSAMANSAAGQQPYVCNWIVGDTYCGKRFSSSDELLQHLRSHTSLSSAAAAAGQSTDPLSAYSHHPLLSGMNLNLSRTYPTPPLSPLSSARFHPYSKPGSLGGLSGIPSLSGLPGPAAAAAAAAGLSSFTPPGGFSSLSHPLSPYYPYAAFYGQRLGSASSILHP
ncbi:unnamed protein product [Allacma fusca]|uniref:C2H2-type domain-containing protein n=1 Tax=Allacma fusca TaxID=39272 RepID=A0A8J2K3K3_9HEXA|nr:unnamed protein product [Allacma fusca]